MSCKRAVRIVLREGVHVSRRSCLDGIALQAFRPRERHRGWRNGDPGPGVGWGRESTYDA